MDGLSAAASMIAVIQIAENVGSLCSHYLTAVKNAKHDIERLQGELGRLKTILEGAQTLLEGPNASRLENSQAFRGMLDNCLSRLKCLETKLKENLDSGKSGKVVGRLRLRRLKWPSESKDIDDVTQILHKFQELLSTGLNIDQTTLLLDHLSQVESKERLEILEWTSAVPYGKHHNAIREARAPNTCEWLLQHERFREWDRSSSSVILWLQGSPGAGKTFLTSKVIDHVHSLLETTPNQEGFAFFYCNRNETERREPLSVLQSYVRQLSTATGNLEAMRRSLRNLYQDTRLKGSGLTFDSCREQLLRSVSIYQRTTLVLDALDECEPDSRDRLVETIEFLLSNSRRPVKVFISSRPDRDIRRKFLDRPNIEIQARHNKEDIRKFIDGEIIKHGNWDKMSSLLKQDIVNVLFKHGEGMFQWVYLQIKQVLDLESEEAIRARLGKLPRSLKAAYDEIYSKIQARNKYDKALADRAFMWVMCAQRPMSSEELLSAIRLDPEDTAFLTRKITETQLLHLCNNLLVLDSQRKVWRFSHLSVTEYFEKNHWDLQQAHGCAAKICLRLLIKTYEESGTSSSDSLSSKHDRESKYQDIFDSDHPLQDYSRRHWVTHVQATEEEEPGSVLALLLKIFLGSPGESSAHYRQWHRWVGRYLDPNIVRSSEISPANSSVFAMCRFSFYGLLSDWWDNAEIPLGQTNIEGDNLLNLAAVAGCRPICETLIRRGMDVNLQSGTYGNALAAAAIKQNTEIIKFLIEQGANINIQPQTGYYGSALLAAAALGGIETTKFLIEQGADANMQLQTGYYGSPLAAAAAKGQNTETIKFLIEQGADVNMQLQAGQYGSALAAAAFWGWKEGAKSLIDAGAKTNLRLENGLYVTALYASQADVLQEGNRPWGDWRNDRKLRQDKRDVAELLQILGAVNEELPLHF